MRISNIAPPACNELKAPKLKSCISYPLKNAFLSIRILLTKSNKQLWFKILPLFLKMMSRPWKRKNRGGNLNQSTPRRLEWIRRKRCNRRDLYVREKLSKILKSSCLEDHLSLYSLKRRFFWSSIRRKSNLTVTPFSSKQHHKNVTKPWHIKRQEHSLISIIQLKSHKSKGTPR